MGNSSILNLRTDFLTELLSVTPYLASEYFYIIVIALGYWLNPKAPLFRSLGFLIPFSTLFNCLLKNIFQIPRPDASLHLILVHDPYGFPSGDVTVTTVFWALVFLSIKNSSLRYLCLLPIFIVSFARVYLGVHSVFDVIGGFVFGLSISYMWKIYFEEEIIIRFTKLGYKRFWLLSIVLVLVYAAVSYQVNWPPMAPMAIGGLIGFGLSLKYSSKVATNHLFYKMSIPFAIASLIVIVAIAKFMPIVRVNFLLFHLSITFKYAVILFSIFTLAPSLFYKLAKQKL